MTGGTQTNVKPGTAYARQVRQAARNAANANKTRCQSRLSRGFPCRTPLRSRFVDGETVPFCPTCDRKDRGICIDCGVAPVYGQPRRALRCALCRKLAVQASSQRYKDRHQSAMRAKEQQRMADPVTRADRLLYKRLYRQTVPSKIAAYKQQYAQRHRDKLLEYHRQYREARRAERAARELARYHGTLGPRTCLSCDTVLTGRPKKCDQCKTQTRRAARMAIALRLDTGGRRAAA